MSAYELFVEGVENLAHNARPAVTAGFWLSYCALWGWILAQFI